MVGVFDTHTPGQSVRRALLTTPQPYPHTTRQTPHIAHHTGGRPLTSPTTGVEFKDQAAAVLAPVVLVRGFVSDFRAAKEREWREAERRWREAQEEGQEGYGRRGAGKAL